MAGHFYLVSENVVAETRCRSSESPQSGVRIAIERAVANTRSRRSPSAPWTYEGSASVPDGDHAVRVVVSEAGERWR